MLVTVNVNILNDWNVFVFIETLDTLESWVTEVFSSVPNKYSPLMNGWH